ncbi:epoxide hydrolase [Lentinus tigrinus ALCF2SS1-7]|uniref:Epoxide hydrolase n=1 Tax=Lentinus tigrinus ALCF2SS1-6 TaxID=1328759 RepID=A0A5C2RYR5_9APHY|nr:epoxide hydrolase [Lentinus tigrinus ALCF2SS1-6]RPD73929.1 epoxide hydrolase [Lentinus tigrinus ALCF2SS1-7]
MSSPQPFKLNVSDADLDLLHKKLELARFPDELQGAGWDYGVPLADVKRLVARWKDGFDWRKSEAEINKLDMYMRDIDVDDFGSLNIHYLHQKSERPNAIPLLFVHGWPGHFLEVRKLIPHLTSSSPDHPSFHVVAPSLPGFGFSEAPHKPGFAGFQYAEVVHKLMLSLGYNEYVYQGGDFGHTIGVFVVNKYGNTHVKAWHSNMPVYRIPTFFSNPLLFLELLTMPFNKYIRDKVQNSLQIRKKEFGYFMVQSTKPQTIGYSFADSPVGFLAWIYEKLVKASDNYPWTDDEVLEWISIYWHSRAGPAASARIYYELTHGGESSDLFEGTTWTSVPLGVAHFPGEPISLPKSWAHMIGKVVQESFHEKGGHFAAFEAPEALAGDLRKMFGKGGPAYGVVPGKDGY